MRFSFIATHANEFRITTMCRVLQVSKVGYYAWVQRPQSARGVEDAALLTRIETVFAASHQTYGSPRVHAELVATGEAPSVHGVARIMRTAGLRATRPRRFQVTTDSNHPYPIVPNVLDRQFGIDAVPALNRVWIGDSTYISTLEVWLYLAVVLDLRSRRVIGWAMRHTLEGAITRDALAMALQDRRPAAGCLSPSDRGSPGGFNRSSQHPPVTRVSDDANKTTTCNEEHPEDAPFAGTATGRTTRGSRAILGRHSARTLSGGRGRRGAGVLGGGRPLVSTSWGYATNPVGPIRPAALWALPIPRRSRAAGAHAHLSGHARRRSNPTRPHLHGRQLTRPRGAAPSPSCTRRECCPAPRRAT